MFGIVVDGIERHLRTGLQALRDQPGANIQATRGKATRGKATLAARAELWEKLRRSARDVDDYNLDRRPFLLSIFSELADIERRAAQ